MTRLFHLIPATEWRAVEGRDEYAPASLETEGFVHLSTADQVEDTARLFFADVEDLLVLEVEVPDGDPRLRWEPHEGPRGVEDFPHHFGPIPMAHIVATSTLRSGVESLGDES